MAAWTRDWLCRWTHPMRWGLAVLAAALACGLLGLELEFGPSEPGPPPGPLPPIRIDPNTAPAALLSTLPRAGPSMVARLVEAREAAPFRSLGDLERRVKGVGPRTIDRWRPYLSLGDLERPARPGGPFSSSSR